MEICSQLARLHLYNIFSALRLTDAVWVVFLLSRGFTLAQVGAAEGVFHVVSFLFEVPTGMAADLLGRRRTLAAAGLCAALSAVFMAVSSGFGGVCLSMAFSALSYNLASGTQEAITYDSLVMAGQEKRYLRVSAWLDGVARAVSALGCLLGGLALWLGFFKAYMCSAALAGAAVVFALSLTEPAVTQKQRERLERPFADLLPRLREHIRLSFGFLKNNPRAAFKILASAGVAVPIYLSFMYLQEHLTAGGLPEAWLGAALLAVRLAGAAGVAAGAKGRLRLFWAIMLCALLAGLGTAAAGVSGLWLLSVFGALLASFADGLAGLRLDVSLNDDFPSDQRATLVSVNSMVYSLLMIAASPLSGAVGGALGAGRALWMLGGGLIVCAAVFGALYRRMVTSQRL